MPDDSKPVHATQTQATPQSGNADTDMVLRTDEGPVARITMNRPKAYNSLSVEMMRRLTRTLAEVGEDTSIRVVILEGAGKGFCAGHDLKELRSRTDRAFYEEVFSVCCELMNTITRLPQPVIAKVHGIATAAGCQLVATCDLAVADANARLSTPGVNIGLFCSTPMVPLSRNVPRKRAMEMLLTGDMISAPVAAQWGLINEAVDASALEETVDKYAQKVASKSPHVLKIGKKAFYQQLDESLEEAYAHTAEVMTENMLARDAAEGIDAFLEKRQPQWKGE